MEDMPGTQMTRKEREDLLKISRLRMKVAKTDVDRRASELRAEFEQQLCRIYSYDQSEVWAEAHKAAKRAADIAQKIVAEECEKLGIPREFAPSLSLYWHGRGENAVESRRKELRKAADLRIEAMRCYALDQIERQGAEIQTELFSLGMREQAASLLEQMPKPADLMPLLLIDEVQQKLLGQGQGDARASQRLPRHPRAGR